MLGLRRQIDLAFAQTVEQFLGRQIDERDFIGEIEHAIGHGLPDANPGDAPNDVVQAFEVLDIDGRINVDARVEQFLHVLPALHVARALDVRVREFVDENELRLSCERGVEIEFGEQTATIFDARGRQRFEAFDERQRFLAPVRFDHADDRLRALVAAAARGLQHREGLAYASGSAEEDLQPSALAFFFLAMEFVEEFVGCWTGHGSGFCWRSGVFVRLGFREARPTR
ncbi:hypothetical protein AWB82_05666 [Caballeronia glebae]|uniref:Uncharacterized protein n=1 Tax=Caballeronia glebae TaxID=1777143 RepID=A0A158CR42_9BURK|nr:hypothetical protein AWB82_05666 [Caballeronia glebae]